MNRCDDIRRGDGPEFPKLVQTPDAVIDSRLGISASNFNIEDAIERPVTDSSVSSELEAANGQTFCGSCIRIGFWFLSCRNKDYLKHRYRCERSRNKKK